jgi:hypothetical protein
MAIKESHQEALKVKPPDDSHALLEVFVFG